MDRPFIDISVPMHPGMLVWSDHERFSIETAEAVYAGASTRVSNLRMTTHTGTHVDAPLHFCDGGRSVDELSLEALVGQARVCDCRGLAAIGPADLAAAGAAGARVLLRTDNSAWVRTGPVPETPAHIAAEGAAYLIDLGVRLLGIDGLTVDPPGEGGAHLALLRAGVIILETVDLSGAAPGDYHLICLPLRIAGADGAPARAVLTPLRRS